MPCVFAILPRGVAVQEADLYQVRLVDVLDGIFVLADCRRQRAHFLPGRRLLLLQNREHQLTDRSHQIRRYPTSIMARAAMATARVMRPSALDLSVIADAPEKPVRDGAAYRGQPRCDLLGAAGRRLSTPSRTADWAHDGRQFACGCKTPVDE